jgi:hypothetical protein
MPSNGSFWYGSSTGFPGFLYKRNNGVGARKSTKMGPGGNITCNSYTYLYNKYKPGQGGVGASSTSNRRAKNRHATICNNTIIKPTTTSVTYSFTNATLSSNNLYNTIITFITDGTLSTGSTTIVLIIIKYNDGTQTQYLNLTINPLTNEPIVLPPNVSSVSFSFNPSQKSPPSCFPCYMTLGQYSNYTHNPNGYVHCPSI